MIGSIETTGPPRLLRMDVRAGLITGALFSFNGSFIRRAARRSSKPGMLRIEHLAAMTILGVDPGTNVTGYGIVRKNGTAPSHVASGVIRPAKTAGMARRLWEVHAGLEAVIREHGPTVMVVESLFHKQNPQSLMKLSQVRGVILLVGEAHGLDIYEYAPMEIKTGITGYGRADKDQMVYMMSRILDLPNLKSADEADALAMAVYHCHRCSFNRMIS